MGPDVAILKSEGIFLPKMMCYSTYEPCSYSSYLEKKKRKEKNPTKFSFRFFYYYCRMHILHFQMNKKREQKSHWVFFSQCPFYWFSLLIVFCIAEVHSQLIIFFLHFFMITYIINLGCFILVIDSRWPTSFP